MTWKRAATAVLAAVVLSACHRKQQVSMPPPVQPQQPRTVSPKRTMTHRKPPVKKDGSVAAVAPRVAESPKLVDFLTDEQRQQYDREITTSLRTAEDNLSVFRQHGPTEKQREAERVESLVKQSRQERDAGDLTTARKLANMAKVMSDTLTK